MRFVHLHAIAFGPLQERELGLDSDIVLVAGPNEAGKSSFRAALETILYGFKPALRDQHPLAQWNPEQPQSLQLEAELRLDTGEIHGVERVLLQTGKSRLATGSAAFRGPRQGNGALPWVAWLSREIFRALYSLEVGQLAALDRGVRDDVDSLLLPQTHALPLRSVAEVRAGLQRDHLELWRPDNRGKPDAKRLRAALSEARSRASQAAESERELRAARVERAERESQLDELRERKRSLDREHADAPLLGELFELNRRRRKSGSAVDLSALGELPLVQPSQLGLEIEQLQARLREPRARLEQTELSLEERQRAISNAALEIERAVAEEASWRADALRRDEHRHAAQALRERAGGELAAALGGSGDEAALARAAAIPLEALGAVLTSWSRARDQQAERLARTSLRLRLAAATLGGVGLAGVVCANLELVDPRAMPAGAVLVFGALLLSLFSRPGGRAKPPAAPAELVPLLSGLPIAEPLLASPAALERLIALLGGVQRLLAEARAAERVADRLDEGVRERERGWRELCRRIGVDSDGSGDLLTAHLRAALAAARADAEQVRRDGAERAEAARLCERDAPLLERRCEHRRRLEVALRSLEPSSSGLDEAFDRVQERLAEEDFLRRRLSELRKTPRFALLEDDPRALAERAPSDAPWLPEVEAARQAQLEALDEQIGAEQRRLGELSELLGSGEGSRLARATDSLRAVEEELGDVERERDRLALLDSILARADREFREAHQPDVLRRASLYIERVTRGRYRRLDLLDEDAGQLGVTSDRHSEPLVVGPPLSQGTLDQIYLCLRLGLLDHLDEGRERLPLALDDALLRMDDQRRRAVYALLADIAPVRQVFLLTCHGSLADEVATELKVRRIDL